MGREEEANFLASLSIEIDRIAVFFDRKGPLAAISFVYLSLAFLRNCWTSIMKISSPST